jgi:hypothetical protein
MVLCTLNPPLHPSSHDLEISKVHSHNLTFRQPLTVLLPPSTWHWHHPLRPSASGFLCLLERNTLNYKGGGIVGYQFKPWCIWLFDHLHPHVIMWRRDRRECQCSECSIGRLQDQMQTQQEEIASLKLQTEQQVQQLQAQEQ